MTAIDVTGLHALESLADRLHASGRRLLLCGMRDQPKRLMARSDFQRRLGEENILPTLAGAIERGREMLAGHASGVSRPAAG
jgi:SulP family sulfate permease